MLVITGQFMFNAAVLNKSRKRLLVYFIILFQNQAVYALSQELPVLSTWTPT